jgi:hypothetical protein
MMSTALSFPEYEECKKDMDRAMRSGDYETAGRLLTNAFHMREQAGIAYFEDLEDYSLVICAEDLLELATTNYRSSADIVRARPRTAVRMRMNATEIACRIQQSAIDLGVKLPPKPQQMLDEILKVN